MPLKANLFITMPSIKNNTGTIYFIITHMYFLLQKMVLSHDQFPNTNAQIIKNIQSFHHCEIRTWMIFIHPIPAVLGPFYGIFYLVPKGLVNKRFGCRRLDLGERSRLVQIWT